MSVKNSTKSRRKFDDSFKSFASWLRLAPNNKISGGRMISRTPPGKNSIATVMRQAANSIGNQKNHDLTPFFNRIAFRNGRMAAITATARKLSVIIWNMLTRVQPYKRTDHSQGSEKQKPSQVRHIEKRIASLRLSQQCIKPLKNWTDYLERFEHFETAGLRRYGAFVH